jgi:hypothetical protein
MSNEKLSDNWISRLNELESLPGETSFNRSAAWQRLHQRLEEKKEDKKAMWYWLAAACLLAIVSIPFLQRDKPDVPAQLPRTGQVAAPAQQVPAVARMKQAAIDTIRPQRLPRKIDQVYVTADPPVIIPDDTTHMPDIANAVAYTDTPSAATTATAPVPQKMRVVHINEIGGDVAGNAYVYPEHKQFKIAVSGPAGFASQVVSDKTSNTANAPKN